MTKGMIYYTFEYEPAGKGAPGYVELQIHYFFNPSTPETGRYGSPESYDPGSGHEADYDYAEREIERDGKKIFERLMAGEWLDGQCIRYFASREECDLIEGLPNAVERDPDDDRDERIERDRMERETPGN